MFKEIESIIKLTSGGTTSSAVSLPDYIKNIYLAGLMLVGLCCMGIIVYAGILYYTGKPKDAKPMLLNAFYGLLLLLGIGVIGAFINPDLLKFNWNGFDLSGLEYVNSNKDKTKGATSSRENADTLCAQEGATVETFDPKTGAYVCSNPKNNQGVTKYTVEDCIKFCTNSQTTYDYNSSTKQCTCGNKYTEANMDKYCKLTCQYILSNCNTSQYVNGSCVNN